jgi:crotonobetainyl-CoA:carnitine CoA-transferase CaiB-like acyl-CoA transferase
MTGFMVPRIVPYLGSGEVPRRTGARDSVIAVYQTFETADQPMTLGLGNDAIFHRFCQAVGRPEWAEDPANANNARRRARRQELVAEIQAELRRQPRAHWLELFAARGVPAGPINSVDEVVRDPNLLERGIFYVVPSGDSFIPQVGTGWQLDGQANGCRLPPPRLGADSEAVLEEWLGMGRAEVEELRGEGVV